MEEVSNITREEVNMIVNSGFPVIPRRNRAIVTVNMQEGMFDDGGLAEEQYVMSVGSQLTDLTAGDKIILNLEKMMEYVTSDENTHERVGQIKLKPIEVNGRVYALINDNVIEAIDNREEY